MVTKFNQNDFGNSLTFYRNRTIGENGKPLSQSKLTDYLLEKKGIPFTRDQLYKWENGKTEIRPGDRSILLAIIQLLVEYGGINSAKDADQLVNAAGLKNLDPIELSTINLKSPMQSFIEQNQITHTNIRDQGSNRYSTSKEGNPLSAGGKSNHLPYEKSPNDQMYFSGSDVFADRPLQTPDNWDNPDQRKSGRSIAEKKGPYNINTFRMHTGLAPGLPSIFIGRDADLEALKKRLNISQEGNAHNIQVLTAIRGWPGVGKTTIATALAYDEKVIEKYSDGILWISLGPNPNLLANLISWGESMGIQEIRKAREIPQASAMLAAFLREKRVLLIIDDVWNATDALPFEVGGHGCAILVTTRMPVIAAKIVGSPKQIYLLGVLSDKDSFKLMEKLAPEVVTAHPTEIKNLIRKLEGLPLALQVAGRLLQTEYSSGFEVDDLIREISTGKRLLNEKVPIGQESLSDATTPSIAALLYKSIDHLDHKHRDYYALLGSAAPSPAKFDLNMLGAIWKISNPKPIIKELIDRGLLEYLPQDRRYQMHSLLVLLAKSLWGTEPGSQSARPK